MNPIRVEAIPSFVATAVRSTRDDGHGNTNLQPVLVDERPGYICRHCLEDPDVGESVFRISYSPFERPGPYRSLGPVFIHTTECPRYDDTGRLPRSLRHRLLSLRAYGPDDMLRNADVAPGEVADEVLDRFFQDPGVEYVDIHNARPGCFNCRVRRG